MRRSVPDSQAGFTYMAVLVLVMIMGIMMSVSAQVWSTVMQREREQELLFRGTQIRDAIERWNNPLPGQPPAMRLNSLKDLLKDPRTAGTIRYLRRIYKDPITGKDFAVSPPDPIRGIIGVASTSKKEPMKQDNFPDIYKDFTGKKHYSDWQFVCRPAGLTGAVTGGVSGLPNSGGTPGGTPGGGIPGLPPGSGGTPISPLSGGGSSSE